MRHFDLGLLYNKCMSIICPTVLAVDPHDYRNQLERITPFAKRIQIDLADGDFAPNHTVNIIQAYWPEGILADLHIMYRRPLEHLETIISLKPNLVIIHAEAQGDLLGMIQHLRELKIQTGVALLKETQPEAHAELIKNADHVLLFSGDLGHFGGQADLRVLGKVAAVKAINPHLEIGWDGGVNADNAHDLAAGGVDVLNVGGFIQKSEDPAQAYEALVQAVSN